MTQKEQMVQRIIGAAVTVDPPARKVFIPMLQFMEVGFGGDCTRIPIEWSQDELSAIDVYPDRYLAFGRIKIGD